MRCMMTVDMKHLRLVRGKWEVRVAVPGPLTKIIGQGTLTFNTGASETEQAKAIAIREIKVPEFKNLIRAARTDGDGWPTDPRERSDRYIAELTGIGERLRGINDRQRARLLRERLQDDVKLPAGTPAVEFETTLDAWARDNGRAIAGKADPKDKGVQAKRRAFADLFGFLQCAGTASAGHTDLARITTDDLFRYRRDLIDRLNAGQIGKPKTAEDYLTHVKAIFSYAVRERLISSNPGEGVSYKGHTDAADKYQDFSDADIALILAEARKAEPFIRWFHWLGAYSGARCAEIAEARVRDVETIGGIAVLHIRRLYRPGKMHSLKTGEISERPVPLHSAILAEGFLAYVESIRREHGEDAPLFPSLRIYNGRLNTDASARSMEWLRKIGITEAKKCNHSWRHTMKTTFRHSMEEQFSDFLTGHANGKEGRDYGKWPIPLLAKHIAAVPVWDVAA